MQRSHPCDNELSSQPEPARSGEANHPGSQRASLLKSRPRADLPASLPASISQPASQAKAGRNNRQAASQPARPATPARMGPGTDVSNPKTDILGRFLRGAKRFWPLQPPIGLIFEPFAITRRDLTDPGDGFALKRPMARDHPATPGPDPDFDFLGAFLKVAKRFSPLRPPIGLRFDSLRLLGDPRQFPETGWALKGLWLEIAIPRFSGFLGPPFYVPILVRSGRSQSSEPFNPSVRACVRPCGRARSVSDLLIKHRSKSTSPLSLSCILNAFPIFRVKTQWFYQFFDSNCPPASQEPARSQEPASKEPGYPRNS